MKFEQRIAAVFRMSEAVWARHANPWSVWSRTVSLPLLVLALWSRTWLGWWSLAPTAIVLAWIWFNPRIFPVPASTNNWASKAVLGERVWLNRGRIPIPPRHRSVPHVLNAVSSAGLVFVVWGVVLLAVWPTLLGIVLVLLGKLWFVDRMVWLFEDMKDAHPAYRRWLY